MQFFHKSAQTACIIKLYTNEQKLVYVLPFQMTPNLEPNSMDIVPKQMEQK